MAMTASEARAKFFPLIEQVNDDAKPVLITSKAGNAVLLSESEYESIIEMAYLLSTSANREWLIESLRQAEQGNTKVLTLPITTSKKVRKSTPRKSVTKAAKKVKPSVKRHVK